MTELRVLRGIAALRSLKQEDVAELPEGRRSATLDFLDEGFRFVPRKGEGQIISKIEAEAREVAETLFAEADAAVARLYEEARPVKSTRTRGTEVDVEREGEPDWRNVDGMDIERAIMGIRRAISPAITQVAELKARVLFARNVAEDEYWEAYKAVLDGTVKDRESAANRATRDSRYYFLYLHWVWSLLDERLGQHQDTVKSLEFMRSRLIKDQEGDRWGDRRPGG